MFVINGTVWIRRAAAARLVQTDPRTLEKRSAEWSIATRRHQGLLLFKLADLEKRRAGLQEPALAS